MKIRKYSILLFSALLIFILSFSVLSPQKEFKSVYADNLPTVTMENKTVHRGQTFSIDVSLDNNLGFTSLCLVLEKTNFDSSVFTLVEVVRQDALSTLTYTQTNTDTEFGYNVNSFRMVWDGRDQDFSNGTLVTLVFESNIEAEVGEYHICLTYDQANTESSYLVKQQVEIVNSTITLIQGEFTAKYLDDDGTELYVKDYNANDIPSYVGATPTKAEDDCYTYSFKGWKGIVSDDINIICYQAQYNKTPKSYQLIYFIADYAGGEIGEFTIYEANEEVAYDSIIESPTLAPRAHYVFFGWYLDEECTIPFQSWRMTSEDLYLYGYYKLDIREINVPKITLTLDRIEGDYAYVDCYIVLNTGFNGMVLTPSYDHTMLKLVDFEQGNILTAMQFDTTNTLDYSIENFKFYFESSNNNYETGLFLTLKFELLSSLEEQSYPVTFTYEPFRDVTYFDSNNELSYSYIEIVRTNVNVGLRYHWNEKVNNAQDVEIDVTSVDGKPLDMLLEVELVTEQVVLTKKTINETIGRNMKTSSVYSIKLVQNGVEIPPNTTLRIKITLTEEELESKNIRFGYINNENKLIEHDFDIELGNLLFTTDHLSEWVIFVDTSTNTGSASKITILILLPSLLAVATMQYVLIIRAKNKKLLKKETDNAKGDM